MVCSVWSADRLYFLLHSTCNEVKSYSLGGASVPFLVVMSVTVNSFPSTLCKSFWPSSTEPYLPLVAVKVVSRYTVDSTQ